MTGRKKTKFPLRNVGGSMHSIGYLAAVTDMNKEKDSGKLFDYINRD